jgi:hypothetical protein
MSRLSEACIAAVAQNLDVENVLSILMFAELYRIQLKHSYFVRYQSKALQSACKEFASYRVDALIGTADFTKLSDVVREEVIQSKKEGVWMQETDSTIDTLAKKIKYLKFKWNKKNH